MRLFWIALFLLIVLAIAIMPSLVSHDSVSDEELLVISPHWDGIRYEFEGAFTKHYLASRGRRIRVTWLDIGDMGQISKYLNERNAQNPGGGVGADILFGGGMDLLPRMANAQF